MKILRDLLAQIFFVVISVAGFSNDATGQAITDISGTVFGGVKINGPVQIMNGDIAKYLRGDGSAATIPVTPTFYGTSGTKTVTKIWSDVITPSTGDGAVISISSAGFTNIISVTAVGAKNTGTVTSSPNVSIKSFTTTSVILNITEGSTNIVNLLATSLLSGAPTVFANTSGLTVHITVYGN